MGGGGELAGVTLRVGFFGVNGREENGENGIEAVLETRTHPLNSRATGNIPSCLPHFLYIRHELLPRP
jgi:hypothetical protein